MGMEWNGREREGKGKGEGREREGKGSLEHFLFDAFVSRNKIAIVYARRYEDSSHLYSSSSSECLFVQEIGASFPLFRRKGEKLGKKYLIVQCMRILYIILSFV